MALKEKEMGISRELQKKKELEEKIARIKSLFGPDEAEVRVQGDNLLIRLSGLKFQPGKAIIQPEYFSLLTKVQRALREFPKSYVVVQGHTDATGNAYKNKLLSEKRALAVKEYLNANIDLDPNQIQVIGMGDQMPIASNKTAEGRAKNRRIDILIALPK
jgi:outer membrane protein OmpA-like peptidoglycan-associated protein